MPTALDIAAGVPNLKRLWNFALLRRTQYKLCVFSKLYAYVSWFNLAASN